MSCVLHDRPWPARNLGSSEFGSPANAAIQGVNRVAVGRDIAGNPIPRKANPEVEPRQAIRKPLAKWATPSLPQPVNLAGQSCR